MVTADGFGGLIRKTKTAIPSAKPGVFHTAGPNLPNIQTPQFLFVKAKKTPTALHL
jgi:hypothetical protein